MRIRLLFVTNTLEYGGTERALEELVVRLDRSRAEPIILCYGLNHYSEYLNQARNLAVRIEDKLTAKDFVDYWRTFRRFRPHVTIFVNGFLSIFPWYAYLAARLAGTRGIRSSIGYKAF